MNKLGSIYVYLYFSQHEIDFTKDCDVGFFFFFIYLTALSVAGTA